MKLIRNAGTERVLDLIGPELTAGARLDLMTPVASLFAFDALRVSASKLGSARLILPRQFEDISLQGGAADRPGRNRLNTPALARAMAEWLQTRAEVRCAAGAVPQGLAVMRSSTGMAVKALHGAFGLSTDGLGLTPGNPLAFIQSSETSEEAAMLAQWFDAQWTALASQPDGKRSMNPALDRAAAG